MTWQGERWKDRPFRAWLIRAAVFVVPVIAGIVAATLAARLLPSPSGIWQTIVWWAAVLGASFGVMWLMDRLARKLLPLAALLRMSLVFPNKAPSRFGVTLRSYSSKRIQADVERAHAEGIDDDPTRAAEYVLTLIASMGHHDRLTRGHAERTRAYTDLVAEELRLPQADQDRLRWGALLHDIGKLGVPSEILNSDHGLSEDDWEAVRHHPRDGFELTRPIHAFLGPWALTILHHHERYDGTGYPLGLSAGNISYGARIVAVGDAYDAMTAFRTYQQPLSPATARAELAAGAGTQFDPEVVRAFLALSVRPLRRIAGPLVLLGQLPFVTGLQRIGDAATAALATAATLSVVVVSGLVPGPGSPSVDDAPLAQPIEVVAAAPGDSSGDPAGTNQTTSDKPAPSPTTTVPPTTTTSTTTLPPATIVTPPSPVPRQNPPPPTPTTTTTTLPPWVPTAVNDVAATEEDLGVVVDVLANDSDNDGDLDPASLSVSVPPTNGSATVTWSVVDYTPNPDTNGSDSFDYQVCDLGGRCSTATVTIDVAPVNDNPNVTADSAVTTEDTPTTIDVLANDTDVDADLDPTSLVITVGPLSGTVAVVGNSVVYEPMADMSGDDTFSYQVCDLSAACGTAVVDVTVTPVNDAPVAVNDVSTTNEDTPITIDVLANDTDADDGIDPASLTIIGTPLLGTAEVVGSAVTYSPNADAFGTDALGYDICDLAGACSSATITVIITPVNDTPTAVDDAVDGLQRTGLVIDVLANDSDAEGDSLVISSYDAVTNLGGTVVCSADCTFTPPDPWTSPDTFDYTIDDGNGGTDTATVTVTPSAPDIQLFLRSGGAGDQTSTPVLPFSTDAGPTNVVLPNYDTNRDSQPGLFLIQIEQGPPTQITETDPSKYQLWMYPVNEDLVLSGEATMDIWAGMGSLQAGVRGRLRTYVLDCPSTSTDGTDCVEIAPRRFVDRNPWSTVDGVWEQAIWNYGTMNHTIVAGRAFAVKVTVFGPNADDDMRLAYDAAGFESSFVIRVP